MKSFSSAIKKGLVWLPELGMGHYPVSKDNRPYDASYFERYRQMADTEMGRELTISRLWLVERHYSGPLVDVGIGAGQFVEARPNTRGYDVNPQGVAWLNRRGLWADLYGKGNRFPALTFWDSLEHIDRPDLAVARAEKWVFVSVPIFEGAEHVLRSKHFRKTEHIWYWTHEGLVSWFEEQGFTLVEHNKKESQLGREGIISYAFSRK